MPPEGNYLITGGSIKVRPSPVRTPYLDSHFQALDRLYARASPGAFHNSLERSNDLRQESFPNINESEEAYGGLAKEIWEWIYDAETSTPIMWVHSPTGEETSHIAQAIADAMHQRGELTGSFFFSDISNSGRYDGTRLVPTLAYQLTQSIPQTRLDIANAVVQDRSIFDLTLLHQFCKLVVEPLERFSQSIEQEVSTAPKLFIIHALEECHTPGFEESFIEVLGSSLGRMQHNIPQRFLILGCHSDDLEGYLSKPLLQDIVLRRPLHHLPDSKPTSDSDEKSFLDFFHLSENNKRALLMHGAIFAQRIVKGLLR
ncbi:unnamed protein product [Cyclocybe aegerita]|uniref:Nephrocystin 3-like N-terminal domain-containing protein n=1 Tax=Cyclocybe aegerita TaxID=1973307 RepID=A0A8S0VTJ9_CYCAE|nr:unnamed protein product [Cyclocybe aegerita]